MKYSWALNVKYFFLFVQVDFWWWLCCSGTKPYDQHSNRSFLIILPLTQICLVQWLGHLTFHPKQQQDLAKSAKKGKHVMLLFDKLEIVKQYYLVCMYTSTVWFRVLFNSPKNPQIQTGAADLLLFGVMDFYCTCVSLLCEYFLPVPSFSLTWLSFDHMTSHECCMEGISNFFNQREGKAALQ